MTEEGAWLIGAPEGDDPHARVDGFTVDFTGQDIVWPKDHNGLPALAENACRDCERCTWNPGGDCGRTDHPHCDWCGHCAGRHDPTADWTEGRDPRDFDYIPAWRSADTGHQP